MGGWGCPHQVDEKCMKINGIACDPGMKGCVLFGRFVFANEDKNISKRQPRRNREKDSGRSS